jgi:hypothetical protein
LSASTGDIHFDFGGSNDTLTLPLQFNPGNTAQFGITLYINGSAPAGSTDFNITITGFSSASG